MADITKFTTTRGAGKAVASSDWKTGAASFTIDLAGVKDEKFSLHIKNTSATAGDDVKFTIAKSNGPLGALSNLEITVGDGEYAILGPIDSAKYKMASGTNMGKLVCTCAAATTGGAGAATDLSFLPIVQAD